jgi:hypothetical protein
MQHLPNITYSNDGLTQKSCVEYSNGEIEQLTQPSITRVVTLHLPLFLTIPLWVRHGYSLKDIHTTLEYFSSVHLWQCALLYGISTSNSAIKLAFSEQNAMVYGSKAIVIKKIQKVLSSVGIFKNKESVLDTLRDEHIPPLPIHRIHKQMYEELLQGLPPKDHLNLLKPVEFTRYYEWRDIKVVPLWIEKKAIYCIRIVQYEVYCTSGRMSVNSLSHTPIHIIINERKYAGTEEAMFFSKSNGS